MVYLFHGFDKKGRDRGRRFGFFHLVYLERVSRFTSLGEEFFYIYMREYIRNFKVKFGLTKKYFVLVQSVVTYEIVENINLVVFFSHYLI